MVERFINQELNLIITDYLNRLKTKIKIDKAVLYGSYAKNLAHEHSDIDLLIISRELPINRPKGSNGLFLDKLVGLNNVNPSLEVIGVHPDKLSNPVIKSFFDEILLTGVEFSVEEDAEPI